MSRVLETASNFVRVEVDASIATIRVDRPKLNPLSIEVQDALGEAAGIVGADEVGQALGPGVSALAGRTRPRPNESSKPGFEGS